jgi:hypothetical protein
MATHSFAGRQIGARMRRHVQGAVASLRDRAARTTRAARQRRTAPRRANRVHGPSCGWLGGWGGMTGTEG